jgi:arsenate reductase
MTVTIWHNPKGATSRKVLGLIRAAGIEPEIVDYDPCAISRHRLTHSVSTSCSALAR